MVIIQGIGPGGVVVGSLAAEQSLHLSRFVIKIFKSAAAGSPATTAQLMRRLALLSLHKPHSPSLLEGAGVDC